MANVLVGHRYGARFIRGLDQAVRYRRRRYSSTRTDYSRDAPRQESRRPRLANLLTVDRDRDHADPRRMASLPGATGYSVRANGRVRIAGPLKLACNLDGGRELPSERDFATRLQPIHGAATDGVPNRISMAGPHSPKNQLHRLADRIRRSLLGRDRR